MSDNNKIEISETVNGYHCIWKQDAVEIDVSELRQTAARLSGLITVRANKLSSPHLTTTEYNLRSADKRRDLVTLLNKRYPEAQWDNILEQLSHHVMENLKRGEPMFEINTEDVELVAPEYILDPLIIKGYPNVIFGDPGAFKSGTAVILLIAILLPWDENPIGLKVPNRSYHSIYFDYETDKNTVGWQLRRLIKGHELPPVYLHYRRCVLPLYRDLDKMRQCIHDAKADVTFIDSLGLAAGGNLKETDSALEFYASLRKLNTTPVILAHNAKDPETSKKSIYGNVMFTAQARNVWEIRVAMEEDKDELDVALFNVKAPPFSKLHEPIGFNITFTEQSMKLSALEPKSIGEFLTRMSANQRILEALKSGMMTPKQMQDKLGISGPSIYVALNRLKDAGQIMKVNKGWVLTSQQQFQEEENEGGVQ